MAILASESTWYKSHMAKEKITEIEIANSYMTPPCNADFWDASANQDGSIICYINGTKLSMVCDSITEIGDKAFEKFLALEKITGLDSVTTIGAHAFCYTPNIKSIDLVPENLTSIGASAFRMSNVEDVLDLSGVSLDIVGDMATRHKRWSSAGLSAIQNVAFPKTIYLDVPNAENQDNYPDVKFGTHNGEDVSVAAGGCSSFACYHIWNYIHAGTDKQYDNWLDWYNGTINKNGDFADNNEMKIQTELSMIDTLGWTDLGTTRVSNQEQLQTIIDQLAIGRPIHTTIHSVNNIGGVHTIAIVGCNAKTHKLAVIDSAVIGTSGVVAWFAFEDIFNEGNVEQDRIRLIDYNLPVLAPNNTWITRAGTSVSKSNITSIDIKDTYTPAGTPTASWDASADSNGSIMVYAEGNKLTIAGNGKGKISMNADSSNVFNGFGKLVTITGGNYLDTSRVTTFERMFQACFALQSVDVSTWNTSNATSLKAMFQGAAAIGNLDVSKWNTSNVTDMSVFLNMPADQYTNTNLTKLDVSNWDTSNVTTMLQMFVRCAGLTTLDVKNWDTSSCTNMSSMFNTCRLLKHLDVSNWDTGRVTTFYLMFQNDESIESLDVSKWNTGSCTDMNHMFYNCHSLTALDVSNWDVGNVQTFSSMFCFSNESNIPMNIRYLDVSKWNVGSCTDMSYMFNKCAYLEVLDVSKWNTSNLTNMYAVFAGCSSLRTLDMSNWDTSKVTNFTQAFWNMYNLRKLVLGAKSNFTSNAAIPTPNPTYIAGADGNWYTRHREPYAVANIPQNTANTYYASLDLANDVDLLVKNGSIMDVADAIRDTGVTDAPISFPTDFKNNVDNITEFLLRLVSRNGDDYYGAFFPKGLTAVGNYGFSNCQRFHFPNTLPEGIKRIGVCGFINCYRFYNLVLPATLEELGNQAFQSNLNLETVTFKSKPTSIGSNAFVGCTKLQAINVPWAEGEVSGAPWGATNVTINYNYVGG